MRKGIILLAILVTGIAGVLLLVTKEEPRQPVTAAKGLEAPPFELADLEGKTWRLADLKGKVVLLNFWATWCDTCKQENPSLQALMNAEKENDRFVFLTVLYKDTPANAKEYLKANGFTFPVLIDTNNVGRAYGLTGVPETFLIDKRGIIQEKVIGPMEWNTPEVRAVLAKLANE
ncbi:MAG: TlpA disulfide reductase family protein [Nitrospirota bacterium]